MTKPLLRRSPLPHVPDRPRSATSGEWVGAVGLVGLGLAFGLALAAFEFGFQGGAEKIGLGALLRLLPQHAGKPRLRPERIAPEDFF